jgi:glucose dehydrogenase
MQVFTAGGLLFIAATNDSRFRAFDKMTGMELLTVKLAAVAHATPMTFSGPQKNKNSMWQLLEGNWKEDRRRAGGLRLAMSCGRQTYRGTIRSVPAIPPCLD